MPSSGSWPTTSSSAAPIRGAGTSTCCRRWSSPAVSSSSRNGTARTRSGPTSTRPPWSRWHGPARASSPAAPRSTSSKRSRPRTWNSPLRGGLPGGGGGGTRVLDVAPREALAVPEPGEGGVGHVGEAVADAEVVQAALALGGQAEAGAPAHGVGVPGGVLLDAQLLVGRGVAEGGVEAVAYPHEQAPEHVLHIRVAQVADALRVLEGATLGRDRQGLERADAGAAQRRLLVDLDPKLEVVREPDRVGDARRELADAG